MKRIYNISELERITGISRRTIYYYTQEKLLPPPSGAGLSARYTHEHYLRLKIIILMQKSHMKLAGIKETLEKMNQAEMEREIDKAEHSESDDVWTVMQSLKSDFSEAAKPAAAPEALRSEEMSFVKQKTFITKKEDKKPEKSLTWKRHDVMEGIEVNIRSDVEEKYGEIILKLLDEFYKLTKTTE